MQVTLEQCSPRLMGEKVLLKMECFLRHVEITNEDKAHHFLRYQGYCSL
jgi:hypothetical protein